MSSEQATLRDLFSPHMALDAQDGDLAAAPRALGETLAEVLKNSKVELPVARDAILAKIGDVLDLELSTIIGTAWSKVAYLRRYLDESTYAPNETIALSMAKHTIQSIHHPSIDLLINNKRVGGIGVDIQVELVFEGLLLSIQNGKIKEIRPGSCQGKGSMSLLKHVLATREMAPLVLPGTMRFGEGIQIVAPKGNPAPPPESEHTRSPDAP